MKHLLNDYIFSDNLRYEAHRLVYTYSSTEEPIQIGGFFGAALLCSLLINSEEGGLREIPLDIERKMDFLFDRYEQEVIANDWGYLSAELIQLNDAYVQFTVADEELSDLCPNLRQLSIAMSLVSAYMQRLVKEEVGEHIWEKAKWEMPFAQWLFDAAYIETRRQQFLHVDWTDPVAVNALVEMPDKSEKPTLLFEGEDAKDILRRYWEWLWDTARQQAASYPDEKVVIADIKQSILTHETNYNFLKPEMKDFTPDQLNTFRQWMTQWTEFVKQQIEPPITPKKKDLRQELFLDNVMSIPPERNYVEVRTYVIERCKYDPDFKNYFRLHKMTDFCEQLTLLFGWFVDPNALGKRMKYKPKK